MASKKSGRLAGLAALAGLAYMNKDKLFGAKDKGAKDTSAENNRIADAQAARDEQKGPAPKPSEVAEKPNVDLGEIRDEEGTLSKFRRNTETGEMYDPIGSTSGKSAATKVAAPAKAPSAPAAKAPVIGGPTPSRDPGGAGKRGAVSAGPNPARAPGGAGKRGGASSEAAANMMDLPPYRENPDSYDMSMKRGGKVKKMASGGMTSSASKRADGIATKGKTRGRMC